MATRSILKNVDIRNRNLSKAFVEALEHAKDKGEKSVILSRTFKEVSGEKIKDLFKEDK